MDGCGAFGRVRMRHHLLPCLHSAPTPGNEVAATTRPKPAGQLATQRPREDTGTFRRSSGVISLPSALALARHISSTWCAAAAKWKPTRGYARAAESASDQPGHQTRTHAACKGLQPSGAASITQPIVTGHSRRLAALPLQGCRCHPFSLREPTRRQRPQYLLRRFLIDAALLEGLLHGLDFLFLLLILLLPGARGRGGASTIGSCCWRRQRRRLCPATRRRDRRRANPPWSPAHALGGGRARQRAATGRAL